MPDPPGHVRGDAGQDNDDEEQEHPVVPRSGHQEDERNLGQGCGTSHLHDPAGAGGHLESHEPHPARDRQPEGGQPPIGGHVERKTTDQQRERREVEGPKNDTAQASVRDVAS